MLGYVARRLVLALFTAWAVSILAFGVISLAPGDWVDAHIALMETQGYRFSLQYIEGLRTNLGLDDPLTVQYYKWASRIVTKGDFGYGFEENRAVTELVAERLMYTVVLTAFTTVLVWSFALPVGIYSAVRQHSVGDYVFTFFGFAGIAVPDFLLGLVMMYVAFAYFEASVGGLFSGEYETAPWSLGKVLDLLAHLIIPAVVLGTSGTAGLIRIMRNNLLDELSKPYVTTARSKGLANWRIITKYPVRIALNPFISTTGYLLPGLVGGSTIVAIVLGLPMLGPLLLQALISQDMFVAGSIILLLGILTVIGTLISDLLLVVVDPRIKLTG